MMVGGTLAHNVISVNLVVALHAALRASGCRVFSSDVKVLSRDRSESTYPDVTVVRGGVQLWESSVEEPALVAEMLSRSTAYCDRGAKAQTHKRIPSLRYLLIVEQDRREVALFRRSAAGWEEIVVERDGSVELPDLGCRISLDAIYEGAAP